MNLVISFNHMTTSNGELAIGTIKLPISLSVDTGLFYFQIEWAFDATVANGMLPYHLCFFFS